MSSGLIPTPVSLTEIHTASRDTRRSFSSPSVEMGSGARVETAEMLTLPLSGVNFEALERRLKRICRSLVPSARMLTGADAASTRTS